MKLHRLGAELRSRVGECERLQKIVNQHQRAQDRLRQEVEYRMFSLRVSAQYVRCYLRVALHRLFVGLSSSQFPNLCPKWSFPVSGGNVCMLPSV